jgi:PEGA domain-containing protein
MSKKRKKRAAPEGASPHREGDAKPPRRKSGAFFWGLAAGFLATLLFVLAVDLGWMPLAAQGTTPVANAAAITPPATRRLAILGKVPEGAALLVDEHPVASQIENGWTRVTVPSAARAIEMRGQTGAWWKTDLTTTPSDTLRPVWSGEVVVLPSPTFSSGTLYVDGQPMGAVPGTVSGIAPGWHVLSARTGDGLVYEDARAFGPGEVAPWTVPAPPPQGKGRLVVRSRRMGDDGTVETQARSVRVDGRLRGATPLELNVPAGYHSVAVDEPEQPVLVQVLRIEAGSTRYVESQVPREPDLGVEIGRPTTMKPEGTIIVPVRIVTAGAPIQKAVLQLVRSEQSETIQVPLSVSPSDPQIWVGVIPKSLLALGEPTLAFASGTDVNGKEGCSEIIDLAR